MFVSFTLTTASFKQIVEVTKISWNTLYQINSSRVISDSLLANFSSDQNPKRASKEKQGNFYEKMKFGQSLLKKREGENQYHQ